MSTDQPPAVDPDQPEGWFFEWDDIEQRSIRQRIMDWWRCR